MDAIELLLQQHREAEELFDKIEKGGAGKRATFDKLADALAIHATIEEKIFYPQTKSARTDDLLHEAVEEHLSVKRLLADMLELEADDETFDAKLKVLKEQVEHHVEEEEEQLFPAVRKMLSRGELSEMGEAMEELADDVKAGVSPRELVPGETDKAAPI